MHQHDRITVALGTDEAPDAFRLERFPRRPMEGDHAFYCLAGRCSLLNPREAPLGTPSLGLLESCFAGNCAAVDSKAVSIRRPSLEAEAALVAPGAVVRCRLGGVPTESIEPARLFEAAVLLNRP